MNVIKKIIFGLAILILLQNYSECFAIDNFSEQVKRSIESSLPANWEIFDIEENADPEWSFTDNLCIKIQLYGPNMTGYKYYDKNDEFICEKDIFNEGISLWITDKNFDHGWTIAKTVINAFSKVPLKFPRTIYKKGRYIIYAKESLVVLEENKKFDVKSPEGTRSAYPTNFKNGKTWSSWIQDLEKSFKKSLTTQ